jgi:hypothetical protein
MWNPDFTVAEGRAFLDAKLGKRGVYARVHSAMDRAKTDLARKRLAFVLTQYDRPSTSESYCECCGYMEHDNSWQAGYMAD